MQEFDFHPLSAQERLDLNAPLQRAFIHLWHCGPATTALAIAAMLDRAGISAAVMDVLPEWQATDPAQCVWHFDVKTPRRRRRNHLRLVPEPAPDA